MRLLNPLQWNFGPRTTATLLTWAIVPAALGLFTMWRSLMEGAAALQLTNEQLAILTGGVFRSMLFVAIPVLVVCVAAAVLFSWVIVQPLWRLRKAMEQVTQGNLAEDALPVNSRDEVGQITGSFNRMVDGLRVMVCEVARGSDEVDAAGSRLQECASGSATATDSSVGQIEVIRAAAESQVTRMTEGAKAAEELQEAAEQVAASADSQAREVESAAGVVQQVAAAIEQVAASAGVVSEAAANTRAAADDGGRAVQAVVSSMGRLKEQVLATSGQITELSVSLSHVDEILALISEIADQTDLLALNAAIEAARVGEHGRGFAVVAGEARRLAERSRRAARDIGDRVETIRTEAAGVVRTMETGTREVEQGVVLAQNAGTALNRIQAAVAETQDQVESISAASEEITAASVQMVTMTHHLSAIAEENAATAEEMLAGARSVAHLIGGVEAEAQANQQATVAMASAAKQVRAAVSEEVACASQLMATSRTLREHVRKFRLRQA